MLYNRRLLVLQKADEWADGWNKADCKEVERRSRKDDKCCILSLLLSLLLLLRYTLML